MSDNTKQTFRQFCENQLSTRQFNTLYELPNTTRYSITNALKKPQKMSFQLLLDIADAINQSPLNLALYYECSLDTMTARQYLSLLEK
ncbi:hypothetical protein [Aureispira sp. CCB-QB1]|uniref:hypothetical protein n=1 Tax=Aureispira sp. CCB-QB1 TaxID=1313421 RepID=UPI000695E902|nr:hypothetical protein [Aureispira sp. CCB-QB1]